MEWLLFTQPFCYKCPKAKELMKDYLECGRVVDCSTEDGMRLAKEHGIMQTPTLLIGGQLITSYDDMVISVGRLQKDK